MEHGNGRPRGLKLDTNALVTESARIVQKTGFAYPTGPVQSQSGPVPVRSGSPGPGPVRSGSPGSVSPGQVPNLGKKPISL